MLEALHNCLFALFLVGLTAAAIGFLMMLIGGNEDGSSTVAQSLLTEQFLKYIVRRDMTWYYNQKPSRLSEIGWYFTFTGFITAVITALLMLAIFPDGIRM